MTKLQYQIEMKNHYKEESKIYKEAFEKYKTLARKALDELEKEREENKKLNDLSESATELMRFYNLQKEQLLSIIEEVKVMPKFAERIINNGLERFNLDTDIHNSQIADKLGKLSIE